MNDYEQLLRLKWNEINYYYGGSIQLAIEHPLEWHVGYFSENQKAVIIISKYAIYHIESSQSINVACKLRQDGRFAIYFVLLDQEQEDVFIAMCGDMIQYSSASSDYKKSLFGVEQRYIQWGRLLKHKKNATMSITAQKGLIGELLYLKEMLEEGQEVSSALNGWVGPNGAYQDFVYNDGWHEVKTVGISSTKVTISSIEQLDCDIDGELVIIRVDKCAPAHTGSFSLSDLVHRILLIIKDYPWAVDLFIEKLNYIGYIDQPIYNEQKYLFLSKQCYTVVNDFPRLKRKNLPIAVVNVSYDLNLPSIQYWAK